MAKKKRSMKANVGMRKGIRKTATPKTTKRVAKKREDLPLPIEEMIMPEPTSKELDRGVAAIQSGSDFEYPPIVESMVKIGYCLLGHNAAGEVFMEKAVPEGKGLNREFYRITRDGCDLEFVGNGILDKLMP